MSTIQPKLDNEEQAMATVTQLNKVQTREALSIVYVVYIVYVYCTYIYYMRACECAKSLQLCLILCSLIDCSSPGFSVRRILQARILGACPPPENLPNPGIEPKSQVSYIGRQVLYH